jgi:hypothetical protein
MIKKYQQKKALHMKKMCFSLFVSSIFCINIFSSEKKEIKPVFDWKAELKKLSPIQIELDKEEQALERACMQHNTKEYAQHKTNIEILQLKRQIELHKDTISSMQSALEQKDLIISQLQSNK